MPAWCLPRPLTDAFLAAFRDGVLDPMKLMAMTSAERRAAFGEIVGADNAAEINAGFERTMLLKDQKAGMARWAQSVAGLKEPVRRDMLAQIGRLDKVLQPVEERDFLADLAAKKLGTEVTAEEAQQIFDLSRKAETLRAEITNRTGDYRTGWTAESGTAYGEAYRALREKIESLKPNSIPLRERLLQLPNLPREIQTSIFHWSAPFVQLYGMISDPIWYRGLGTMFQYFADERNYQKLEAYMFGHPDYAALRQGGLQLTHLGDRLTNAEEGLQSHLLLDANQWLSDRTGWAPNLIRAWQRSFVGVCNFVRFSKATELLQAARMVGRDVEHDPQLVSDIASVVNNFTGRGGEISGPVGTLRVPSSPELATIFYAPRKFAATMEMFNPFMYARLDPFARQAAFRQLFGTLLVTGSVLTLAKFAGARVSFDPRDTNFAKIDIGGEKLDMTGGNASYLRFLTRLVTNQEIGRDGTIKTLGTTFGGQTREDLVTNFIIGKLSPIGSMIANALRGHDFAGKPETPGALAYDAFTPIAIRAQMDYWLNNPGDMAAAIPSLLAFLGVSLESPQSPQLSETGRDVWGDYLPPVGTPKIWWADPVNQALDDIGYTARPPPDKINGQPLTAQQSDDYLRISGRLAHARLEQLVSASGWSALPAQTRLAIAKSVIQRARRIAQTQIGIESLGTDHDILKGAYDAKMARAAVASAAAGLEAPAR